METKRLIIPIPEIFQTLNGLNSNHMKEIFDQTPLLNDLTCNFMKEFFFFKYHLICHRPNNSINNINIIK